MFQVYAEYLEECATERYPGMQIEDVFNTALQALAAQTTSIILQFSVFPGNGDAQRQKKAALDICDKHYRAIRKAIPEQLREAHAFAVARTKGPWE